MSNDLRGALWVIVICLAVVFLLSGFEAGLFALNRLRLRQLERAGSGSALRLLGYLDRSERFLWTILVGSTLANVLAITLVLKLLKDFYASERIQAALVFVIVGWLVYVFCELLPKTLFRAYPEQLCRRLLFLFQILDLALSPLVFVVEQFAGILLQWSGGRMFGARLFANRDEFRQIMRESSSGLTTTERSLIDRILDLQGLTVGDLARPMRDVICVEADTPLRLVVGLCEKHELSRLPVWLTESGKRRIGGIVSLRSILYGDSTHWDEPAKSMLSPALYFEGGLPLEEALRRLQRSGNHVAIVLGSEQREIGVVTLWDLLRVLVSGKGAR